MFKPEFNHDFYEIYIINTAETKIWIPKKIYQSEGCCWELNSLYWSPDEKYILLNYRENLLNFVKILSIDAESSENEKIEKLPIEGYVLSWNK